MRLVRRMLNKRVRRLSSEQADGDSEGRLTKKTSFSSFYNIDPEGDGEASPEELPPAQDSPRKAKRKSPARPLPKGSQSKLERPVAEMLSSRPKSSCMGRPRRKLAAQRPRLVIDMVVPAQICGELLQAKGAPSSSSLRTSSATRTCLRKTKTTQSLACPPKVLPSAVPPSQALAKRSK